MRRTALLALCLLSVLSSAGTLGPAPATGGAGGAAYTTATITTGSIAGGASETGDEAAFFDLGIVALVTVASTASTCVTVELFADDGYSDRVYLLTAVDGQTSTFEDRGAAIPYEDTDASTELHWKVTNCGVSATVVTLTVGGIGE